MWGFCFEIFHLQFYSAVDFNFSSSSSFLMSLCRILVTLVGSSKKFQVEFHVWYPLLLRAVTLTCFWGLNYSFLLCYSMVLHKVNFNIFSPALWYSMFLWYSMLQFLKSLLGSFQSASSQCEKWKNETTGRYVPPLGILY